MPPILFHIYGSIAIHSFGVMIALGLIITLYALHHDGPLAKLISQEQLTTIFQISFVSGIAGGRILFLTTNWSTLHHWTDAFMVWNGGLSLLGALIGIITMLYFYFHTYRLPSLKILDRIALYIPLLQSISRLGCFFAGCCFGLETQVPWAVMYTNQDSLAPLCTHLHPTQLYSSLLLFTSFIILLIFNQKYHRKKDGQIIALYVMLMSSERFVVDFFRGDQEFCNYPYIFKFLSIQQILALGLFLGALIMMTFISIHKKSDESI